MSTTSQSGRRGCRRWHWEAPRARGRRCDRVERGSFGWGRLWNRSACAPRAHGPGPHHLLDGGCPWLGRAGRLHIDQIEVSSGGLTEGAAGVGRVFPGRYRGCAGWPPAVNPRPRTSVARSSSSRHISSLLGIPVVGFARPPWFPQATRVVGDRVRVSARCSSFDGPTGSSVRVRPRGLVVLKAKRFTTTADP